jgi:acyl-coenzyme A synthetase/AMP-(fatty) acid ligase
LKIYQNGLLVNLSNKVLDYVDKLKKEQVVTVCSIDHTEHIAAYVAWMTVGGNIFIKAPFLSKTESSYLDEKVLNLPYDNSLFFHTSGTTGLPKIAVHQQQQAAAAYAAQQAAAAYTAQQQAAAAYAAQQRAAAGRTHKMEYNNNNDDEIGRASCRERVYRMV